MHRPKITLYDYCIETGRQALIEQWLSERNGDLRPENVTYRSSKKVWWRCEKGHEWQASICHRSRDVGCPYCSGRIVQKGVNDLATIAPEVAAQWHPVLNGERTPDSVAAYTHAKAWWICDKGHEWNARIGLRADRHKSGCPFCNHKANKTRCGKQLEMLKEAKANLGVQE